MDITPLFLQWHCHARFPKNYWREWWNDSGVTYATSSSTWPRKKVCPQSIPVIPPTLVWVSPPATWTRRSWTGWTHSTCNSMIIKLKFTAVLSWPVEFSTLLRLVWAMLINYPSSSLTYFFVCHFLLCLLDLFHGAARLFRQLGAQAYIHAWLLCPSSTFACVHVLFPCIRSSGALPRCTITLVFAHYPNCYNSCCFINCIGSNNLLFTL